MAHEDQVVRLIRGIVREEMDRKIMDEADRYPRKGATWTNSEEDQLVMEVNMAMEIIGIMHRRGSGGIKERIKKLCKEGKLYLCG